MTNAPHRFHIYIPREPIDLWDKLKRLSAKEGRKIGAETLQAIQSHLKEHGMLSDKEISRMIEAASQD